MGTLAAVLCKKYEGQGENQVDITLKDKESTRLTLPRRKISIFHAIQRQSKEKRLLSYNVSFLYGCQTLANILVYSSLLCAVY